jgi:hypothetical protein
MPKKRKPKVASTGDTPLTPITEKERRNLDERIKKKYDRFQIPRDSWQGRGLYHPFYRGRDSVLHRAFQGQDGLLATLRVRHVRGWRGLLRLQDR